MALHAELSSRFGESSRDFPFDTAEDTPVATSASLQTANWASEIRYWVTAPGALSMLVSGLFVTIVLLSMALITVPAWRPQITPKGIDRTDFVARVVRTLNAQWSAATEIKPNQVTDLYRGQQIELTDGLAEIRFDDGATVLLEAPATLIVVDDRVGRLQQGKLTARVSPQAAGFAIRTPQTNIVDLGTGFCVAAAADSTDVMVVEGAVELSMLASPSGAAAEGPRRLVAGESMRVTSAGFGTLSEPLKFARRLPTADEVPGILVKETFDHPGFASGNPADWPRHWKLYHDNPECEVRAVEDPTIDAPALLFRHDAEHANPPILSREGLSIGPHERAQIQFDFKLIEAGGNPTVQLRTGDNTTGRLINIMLGGGGKQEQTLAWNHTSAFKDHEAFGGGVLAPLTLDTWYRLSVVLEPSAAERRMISLTLEKIDAHGQATEQVHLEGLYLIGEERAIHAVDWDFNMPAGHNQGAMLLDNLVIERLAFSAPASD